MADEHGNHKGHLWMMLLCCAVMAGGLWLAVRSGWSLGWLLMLACPLLHFLMMKGMMGKEKENCHREKQEVIDIKAKSVE